MLFNSYSFFLFFVLVFAVSRFIGGWTLRKFFLLIVSYIFYAAWNPPFVMLLWFSTLADWILAQKISQASCARRRKLYLFLSISVSLALLGYFKYGGFILDNFLRLMHYWGIPYQPMALDIVLPVGISFYTFQTMSYTIDVYRGHLRPGRSFLDYALYVTFFPQLVAGPIVRASEFLPQCTEPKKADGRQIGWGLGLFILGLFNKTVIADTFMAPVAQKVFDSTAIPSCVQAWAGVLAFAVQIFCDFAGYSTCAIGIAMCLGFELPQNFRFPYAAVGFRDFWRRWHISLSTWLRDYLYVPLGGNRKGEERTLINVLITMFLGGLWHGASWLFVFWGLLNGFYLVLERLLERSPLYRWAIWRSSPGQILLGLGTFIMVCYTWVFFRSPTLERAQMIIFSMNGGYGRFGEVDLSDYELIGVGVITVAVLTVHWFLRSRDLEDVIRKIPWGIVSGGLALMIYAIVTSLSGDDIAFIYFQF